MSKHLWKRLFSAAAPRPLAEAPGDQPSGSRAGPTAVVLATSPGAHPRVARAARVLFCVVILINLAAGGTLWLSKAQSISQSARADLPARLARIEALIGQPDLLRPSVLDTLATELGAAQQDLDQLQNIVPLNEQLGIGPSGDSAHALALSTDMIQAGAALVAAAQILRPALVGLAASVLYGSSGGPQAGASQLTISQIEAAQRNIATAKAAWQQALSDRAAFPNGVPTVSSPELSTIARAMDRVAPTVTVAITATSALLDWTTALLGLKQPTNVLLVEENPDVLRPTGGAITHYAVLRFAQGQLSSGIHLRDMANLDCPRQACENAELPPVASWFLLSKAPVHVGNGNLDPDLTVSGWSIFNHFEAEGGPPLVGAAIIVVTENVFANLLGAIGPVTVPGQAGVFTAYNVTERMRAIRAEETRPDGTSAHDIDVLMLDAIVSKLKSVSPARGLTLANALMHALLTKDLQFFTSDHRVRASLEDMGVAGQVLAPASDSLEIVDTNLSGAPVNPFVAESAVDRVTLDQSGGAQHELRLTYQYRVPAGTSRPPIYSDLVRVVLPNNASNAHLSGPCTPTSASQAFHQLLACQLTLAPRQSVTISFSWQAPHVWKAAGANHYAYTLLLQRQPGANLALRVAISAPSGRSFTAATTPGQLASGQVSFTTAALLSDTTLSASF